MNLVEALESAGVPFRPHRSREGEIYLCCPFCPERHESPDERFRLSVNYLTGLGHCYNCGWASRDSLRSLSYMLDIGKLEPAESPGETAKRPERCELPDEFVPLGDVTEDDDLLWTMKKYLLKRGVTQQQIEEKKIGCALDGQYRYSIIFPVYYGEMLCGYVSRDVTGTRAGKTGLLRYLNSKGIKVAYNVPSPMPKNATIVVTEGIFKALAVERVLPKNGRWFAISVQGSSMDDLQVTQLNGAKEIVLFPDPGKAGRIGFLNIAADIQPLFSNVTVAYPLPELQADELPPRKIVEHLKVRRVYSPLLEGEVKTKELFGDYL
jgi:hypothetical protein